MYRHCRFRDITRHCTLQDINRHCTLQVGTTVSHCLLADFDEWVADRERGGQGFKSRLVDVAHEGFEGDPNATSITASDDASELGIPSGTQVCISRLKREVLKKLRDPNTHKQLRAQIAQDYFMFMHGLPDAIHNRVPKKFRSPQQGSELTMVIFGKVSSAWNWLLTQLPAVSSFCACSCAN